MTKWPQIKNKQSFLVTNEKRASNSEEEEDKRGRRGMKEQKRKTDKNSRQRLKVKSFLLIDWSESDNEEQILF